MTSPMSPLSYKITSDIGGFRSEYISDPGYYEDLFLIKHLLVRGCCWHFKPVCMHRLVPRLSVNMETRLYQNRLKLAASLPLQTFLQIYTTSCYRFRARMAENPSTTLFRDYIRINTMQPSPDYPKCMDFLKGVAASLDLPYKVKKLATCIFP